MHQTIKDGGLCMWLKRYHLPYLSLHIQQRQCSSMATAFPAATKLVRNLTVSERRKGTWVVYVEPRDARLEWANGVSRWFRLFRWIGMMGSDKQCVRLPRHPVKHKRLARWLPSFAKCCPLPQVSRTSTGCFFYWFLRVVFASSGSNKLVSPILDRDKVIKAFEMQKWYIYQYVIKTQW